MAFLSRTAILVILLAILQPAFAQKSLLEDKETLEEVRSGLAHMYNFRFNESAFMIKKIGIKYPNHPVTPLLSALQVQWQYFPIELDEKNLITYKSHLEKSLQLAEKILKKNEDDIEGIYFSLAVYSQLARMSAANGDYIKAAGDASDAYEQISKGFALKDKFKEFYFSSGLYNYYREQYPEDHPVYKPFVTFFKDGDKEIGIKELETAGRESLFSSAEAYSYLSTIYTRYENKPEEAAKVTKILNERYPDNYYFTSRHIESLLFTKNYKLAAEKLELIKKISSPFCKAVTEIYGGMIEELGNKDIKAAKDLYLKGITSSKALKKRGNLYQSLAYAGLARISIKEGERKKAAEYYKKAEDLTDYYWVKKEVRDYFNKPNG